MGSIWIKLDPEFKFYNNLDEIYDADEANYFTNDIDNNNELDDTEILENRNRIILDNKYIKIHVRDCFKIFIPLINYEITSKKTNIFDEDVYVYNPLYNAQLKKYLENTW